MTKLDGKPLAGARKLVSDALLMKSGDVLTIFYDESTADVCPVLQSAAEELEVQARPYLIPYSEQRKFNKNDGLSAQIGHAIDGSRAILTCLAAAGDCTEFRKELVLTGAQSNKRVGHMPGITLDILALVPVMRINYRDVEQRCDDLALALTFGESARIETYREAEHGLTESYCLNLELGGWDRPAVVSPGRIPLGRWGNLPGGETFIAPIEHRAHGQFVLNGAFKDRVLGRRESLVLTFEKGQLSQVDAAPELRNEFCQLFERVNNTGNESWKTLAELGIGVNQGMRKLTGVSVFDEKALGTVHIALGDNTTFGGRTHSPVHEDLVTLDPSFWIDGRAVLDRGRFVFNASDWREDYANFPLADDVNWNEPFAAIRGIVPGRDVRQKLTVEIGVGDGRLCAYTVGNARTTRFLRGIYSRIPNGGARISFNQLDKRVRRAGSTHTRADVHRALSILKKHRLVALIHE